MSHACPPASSDVEQAAWWLAQQHSGEPWTPAQQQALEQWLAAHPSRNLAYTRMQQMWGDFEPAAAPAARTALQAGAQAAAQRRSSLRSTGKRVVQGTTTLALLACLVWQGWQHEQVQYWAADHRSGKGEIITIDLPDHSQITLGSNSAVNVHYGSQERRIELLRGDLLAHVAHLPESQAETRPFVVETANATAQAMGTVYSVRYRPNSETALWPAQGASTLIAVQESSVRACLSEASANSTANTAAGTTVDTTASCHTVQAGQFTRIDAQGLHPLESTAPIGDAPAWTRGQLLVDNLPLPQVLHELERHRPGWLLFDAQALADIRVSGVFDLKDTERSLRALQESTDVYFQSAAPWITQAQRRSPPDASERPARTP